MDNAQVSKLNTYVKALLRNRYAVLSAEENLMTSSAGLSSAFKPISAFSHDLLTVSDLLQASTDPVAYTNDPLSLQDYAFSAAEEVYTSVSQLIFQEECLQAAVWNTNPLVFAHSQPSRGLRVFYEIREQSGIIKSYLKDMIRRIADQANKVKFAFRASFDELSKSVILAFVFQIQAVLLA